MPKETYKTGNPALGAETFKGLANETGETMTLGGTATKTMALLALVVVGAFFTWSTTTTALITAVIASFVGFVVAMVIIFNQRTSPYLAPVYAVLEGVSLGAITAITEAQYPGIAVNAIALTFGTLGIMLTAYKLKLIEATENFKLAVVSATGAIALLYLIDLIAMFFGVTLPMIHSSGPWGIIFSLVVVGIAAANLVLDFDFIEQGVNEKAPKYMEWYGGFGLLVTLVWLYLEILRLLEKLRNNK